MAETKRSSDIIYEELKPYSGWTEDSERHCLMIDLQGFTKEQVTLEADNNYSNISITGERQQNGNKYVRFNQSYKVPENSNAEETSAKFEDGILYVIIPKKTRSDYPKPKEGPEVTRSSSTTSSTDDHESSTDETSDRDNSSSGDRDDNRSNEIPEADKYDKVKLENYQQKQGGLFEQVNKHKKAIITALLAFTLGVFLGQKLRSRGNKGAIVSS